MKIKTYCIAIIALAFILITILSVVMAVIPENYNFVQIKYTVQPGDCLWHIATEFCPNSMDKRVYIDNIVSENNLKTRVIYPGQVLTVYELAE